MIEKLLGLIQIGREHNLSFITEDKTITIFAGCEAVLNIGKSHFLSLTSYEILDLAGLDYEEPKPS